MWVINYFIAQVTRGRGGEERLITQALSTVRFCAASLLLLLSPKFTQPLALWRIWMFLWKELWVPISFFLTLFILIGGYVLYNIVVVLPYIDMSHPWVYMCSSSWAPLPPPSLSHPSGSSQCTSPECPVSCIETGLAVCFTYDNIHVSMLVSQLIPPSPSPIESKRLFYTSVSLLLSRI